MLVIITAERPDTPDALFLIDELQTHLESFYPPESRHGFSVERLIKEGVAFFVLRVEGVPAGCGGIINVAAAMTNPPSSKIFCRPHPKNPLPPGKAAVACPSARHATWPINPDALNRRPR